jgi:hypothetical protein
VPRLFPPETVGKSNPNPLLIPRLHNTTRAAPYRSESATVSDLQSDLDPRVDREIIQDRSRSRLQPPVARPGTTVYVLMRLYESHSEANLKARSQSFSAADLVRAPQMALSSPDPIPETPTPMATPDHKPRPAANPEKRTYTIGAVRTARKHDLSELAAGVVVNGTHL